MNPMDCDVLASGGGGMAGTVAAIATARAGAQAASIFAKVSSGLSLSASDCRIV